MGRQIEDVRLSQQQVILEQKPNYLVVRNQSDDDRTVEILGDLPSVLAAWRSGTRVSPIWAIREFARFTATPNPFSGKSTLFFIGPVQPARLAGELAALSDPAKVRLWATTGCFNTVIRVFDKRRVEEIVAWAKGQSIPFEYWRIVDGRIREVQHSTLQAEDLDETLKELAALGRVPTEPAMRATLQENLAVTATVLARSAAMYPPAYEDFKATAIITRELVREWEGKASTTLELQSRLIAANAAISRFSSQAFSGVPPILATECHFWIHSLLGTGSANIALSRLVSWVQKILGETDLPGRLALLEHDTKDVPELSDLTTSMVHLDRDLLEGTLPASDDIPVPLVTYFSGRDGFSSHLQTLSAPLTTIAECNSYRSSLLTVTHEIAHILVQLLFVHIYPNIGDPDELGLARRIAQPRFRAANWLMAARQLVLEGVIGMAQADTGYDIPAEEIAEELPSILKEQRREAQEIIVHALDFWYFYRGEPDFYIKSIWHSWCAIPGIGDRVSEYLMRTLCAVSITLLREPSESRFPAALRDVKVFLEDLQTQGGVLSDYISIALEHIRCIEKDEELWKSFERRYSARLLLVRLVAIFLASDRLVGKLYTDPHEGKGRGYENKQALQYDQEPIGNPLTFFRGYLKDDPGESESLWVLHCLAFDMVTDA